MKAIRKKYVLGFLLIFLTGVGLLIGGVIHYFTQNDTDLIETQGYVTGVETRIGEHGREYRPFSVKYYVESQDKYYETSVFSWFSHPIHQGDAMTVLYKKDDPKNVVITNTDKSTLSYALMGIGGILALAGIALTFKYLYDVKRGKNPTAKADREK